jgi:23S rRNA (pseudouridine1915-N3)-methyltransferase
MIRIISFGKIKDSHLAALQQEYLKRASYLDKIECLELKNESITEKIMTYKAKHAEEHIMLLSEEGILQTSKEFAQILSGHDTTLTFIIGPAEGFTEELKKKFPLFSLSPLTMMHDLAHVVLIEQIYRALSINKGLPYHKE